MTTPRSAIAALAALLLAVVTATAGDREGDFEKAVPGHVSQLDIQKGKWSFSQLRKAGERLFNARFTSNDGAGRPGASGSPSPTRRPMGTGPLFIRTAGPDANSCAGCHNQPGIGGAGDFVGNVFVSTIAREPVLASIDAALTAERGTTSMNGSALIELLAREMTSELFILKRRAVETALNEHREVGVDLVTHGVSFGRLTALPDGNVRLGEVKGVDKDLAVRPWSQKGTISSLRAFTVNAMNQHHGMEASERFGLRQSGTRDFDRDGFEDELTEGDITALVVFQASLNVPGRVLPANPDSRKRVDEGERLFAKAGCVSCHIPAMLLNSATFTEPSAYNLEGTLRQKDVTQTFRFDARTDGPKPRAEVAADGKVVVRAYTDLKRHKICDSEKSQFCNETLVQGFVAADHFITKRLWDIGNTGPYGHRGDLTTIREAILAHGGEARESRLTFERLPAPDQRAIVEFLTTLQILQDGSEAVVTAAVEEELPYVRDAAPGDAEDGQTEQP